MSPPVLIVFEQLNYTKPDGIHAIFMPVIIEFSRCICTYSSAKFEYVTLILSIFIWKIDKKSVEITQKMDEQEIERDRLVLIETANKLYFSLVNIFEYLCFHYANQKSEKEVYISDDWTSTTSG